MKYLITGDWHLRNDIPICRQNLSPAEWNRIQLQSIRFIFEYAHEHDLTILLTGDIFHRSQPYYGILNAANSIIEEYKHLRMFKLAGNHDLPYHSWENAENSGWAALSTSLLDMEKHFDGALHFGGQPKDPNNNLIITHQLVFPTEKERPIETAGKIASDLLAEYPHASFICLGDYHKSFAVHSTTKSATVINPGCITRQAADFEEYTCGFYVIDTDDNSHQFISINVDTEPLFVKHIAEKKERESRIESFARKIKESQDVSLSFIDNLQSKVQQTTISAEAKGYIELLTSKFRGDKL